MIKAGAITQRRHKLTTGERKSANTKQIAVTTDVKPVRPPALRYLPKIP